MSTLLKSFVEVKNVPAALAKEMAEGPLTNLLSQTVVRPINFEANPY